MKTPYTSAAPAHPCARSTSASCTSHWSAQYVGIPYAENDCAELAVRVQREVFGKTIDLPTTRGVGVIGVSRQIDNLRDDYAEHTMQPQEGDAVLMVGRGVVNHIGVYCVINGEAWVLHSMRNAGHTCLHRLRNLDAIGLAVEGIYTWK